MNTLEIARTGRRAARQIRAQMKAGVLTQDELDRLLTKVEEGFAQMMGAAPQPREPTAFITIDGGRR